MQETRACVKTIFTILAFILSFLPSSASAQGRFSPAIQVGEQIITDFELEQRVRFLTLLRAPGDVAALAREQLITAAIQQGAAASLGVTMNEEALEASLTEFAGRANLTVEQFFAILEQNGIGADTFRDFVGTNLLWRDYIRARFGGEARNVPLPSVARTLTRTGTEGGVRVLYSEIVLPAGTPATRNASMARARELATLSTEEEFSAAARLFSIAGSRGEGGALNWRALESLPENIAGAIGRLAPGNISRPVELDGAIGLYLLRDRERIPPGTPETLNVDYALFLTESDATAAQRIINRIDVCDDLYGIAKGLPEERLIRESLPFNSLPADVRRVVPLLDVGNTAVLNRPSGAAVLILCGRTIDSKSTIDLDLVGTRVLNEKLSGIAAHHLSELRAATFITEF